VRVVVRFGQQIRWTVIRQRGVVSALGCRADHGRRGIASADMVAAAAGVLCTATAEVAEVLADVPAALVGAEGDAGLLHAAIRRPAPVPTPS
jgi:hypothetical protein